MRLVGLIAGLILLPLLAVLGRSFFAGNASVGGYRDLSWQQLADGAAWHDEPVRIRGFVLPLLAEDAPMNTFFLTPSPVRNLGEPLPPREQMIWVQLEAAELLPRGEPIVVWGMIASGTFPYGEVAAGHQISAHGWEVFHAPLPGENKLN